MWSRSWRCPWYSQPDTSVGWSSGGALVGGWLPCCCWPSSPVVGHGCSRKRLLSAQRGWGLDLRVSLFALFTCAWLATRFGTSILIAGFTVGAVVALLGEPRRVAQQLVGIGEGFAIPVFFVHLGTQIDLGALFQSSRSLGGGDARRRGDRDPSPCRLVWRLPLGLGLVASAQMGVPAAVVSSGWLRINSPPRRAQR